MTSVDDDCFLSLKVVNDNRIPNKTRPNNLKNLFMRICFRVQR